MNRRMWLWTALVAMPALALGGLGFANSQKARGYTCPITGETLPCEKCCPLNKVKAEEAMDQGYVCPLTGETLPCPNCCPLNKQQ